MKKDYTKYIKAETTSKNYFAVLLNIIHYKENIKIAHWQTTSYAQHKAFDGVYSSLNDSLDSLVEVVIGKYGRFTVENGNVSLSNIAEFNPVESTKSLLAFLVNEFPLFFAPTDTELLNIRDELLAELNQLLYLLTLE